MYTITTFNCITCTTTHHHNRTEREVENCYQALRNLGYRVDKHLSFVGAWKEEQLLYQVWVTKE